MSRSAVVAARPEEVFELLARPERHAELDGSGTVQGSTRFGQRLALGSRFGMRMRIKAPYRILNTVVEFEEGKRIAWRHWYRHVWRWELVATDGDTRVTETFDWRPALWPRGIELVGYPARNARAIETTLARLVARFGTPEARPGP